MAVKTNKVEFEVSLKKHAILQGNTDEEVTKEVKKLVDYTYYNSADSVAFEVTKIEPIE